MGNTAFCCTVYLGWHGELRVRITPLYSQFFLNILLINWLLKSVVSNEGRPYSGNTLVKWLEMVDAERRYHSEAL